MAALVAGLLGLETGDGMRAATASCHSIGAAMCRCFVTRRSLAEMLGYAASSSIQCPTTSGVGALAM